MPLRAVGFASSGSVSAPTRTVYASSLGAVDNAVLTPGAGVPGTRTDLLLQPALVNGNVKLIVDGRYTLAAPLILYSNTEVEMLPGCGFIMANGSNCEAFKNAHQNAPNVASGATLSGSPSGGMAVSNQVDRDIYIHGGILNMNSTGGAVPGDNKTNPSTNLWINGMRLIGVTNLHIRDLEIYDTAAYALNISNCNRFSVRSCFIHSPLPLQLKNTDGVHLNGPCDEFLVADCTFITGDDPCACNADDGQEVRLGDGNQAHVAYPGVVFGPITRGRFENNNFDGCATGYRFLSVTERIDKITIVMARGNTMGPAIAAARFYNPSLGPGNFGSLSVYGAELDCNISGSYARGTVILLDGNFEHFSLDGYKITNPAIANYLIRYAAGGTMQQMSIRDVQINNPSGAAESVLVRLDGTVQQLSINGLLWNQPSGYVIGGDTAPASLAMSNYVRPAAARILGPGTTPGLVRGDAFPDN